MLELYRISLDGFCSSASDVLQIVGWVLTIFKVAIPLLIIIYGVLDFGKAVTAAKDDEIKKSAKSLAYRAVAGIIIFFVPALVLALFRLINGFTEATQSLDYEVCENCILHPSKCGR